MRPHQRITTLLQRAQHNRQCATAPSRADQMAMLRRVHNRELVNPYRGLFADASYWNTLNEAQRVIHMARALSQLHPQWVFAGPTAAALHGFDHPWTVHRSGLYIADSSNGSRAGAGLSRIHMNPIPKHIADGVPVTPAARTLVDCGLLLPFPCALAIFDSAFRMAGVTPDEILDICRSLRRDVSGINRLLAYVDPKSENGGESMGRGVMIERGFMAPRIQVVISNPANPNEWYRVDYVWFLDDGRIIVAEFDGMRKYVDPSMTDRRSVKTVVNQQTQRERRLLSWGVTAIVRFDFDDVLDPGNLTGRLMQAGVPRYAQPLWQPGRADRR